jgi:hypothetical protein
MYNREIVPYSQTLPNNYDALQNWDYASPEDREKQLRTIIQRVILRYELQEINLQNACLVVKKFCLVKENITLLKASIQIYQLIIPELNTQHCLLQELKIECRKGNELLAEVKKINEKFEEMALSFREQRKILGDDFFKELKQSLIEDDKAEEKIVLEHAEIRQEFNEMEQYRERTELKAQEIYLKSVQQQKILHEMSFAVTDLKQKCSENTIVGLGLISIIKEVRYDFQKIREDQQKLKKDFQNQGETLQIIKKDFQKIGEDQRQIANDQRKIAKEHKQIAADQRKIAADQQEIAAHQEMLLEDFQKISEEQRETASVFQELRESYNNRNKELDKLEEEMKKMKQKAVALPKQSKNKFQNIEEPSNPREMKDKAIGKKNESQKLSKKSNFTLFYTFLLGEKGKNFIQYLFVIAMSSCWTLFSNMFRLSRKSLDQTD